MTPCALTWKVITAQFECAFVLGMRKCRRQGRPILLQKRGTVDGGESNQCAFGLIIESKGINS
jgi:hypothetical protein